MIAPKESSQAEQWSWVRSGVLIGAAQLITELGGDASSVCRASGIPEEALSESDLPLPGAQVVDFVAQAARQTGCGSFGIQLGLRQTLAVLGPVWLLLESAGTVSELLRDLAKYFSLHTRSATVGAENCPEGMWVSYHIGVGAGLDDSQVVDLGLALLCKELRQLAPAGWQPVRVELRHSAPAQLQHHRQALGSNLAFNQARNAILIQKGLLTQDLPTRSSQRHNIIGRALERRRIASPQDLVQRAEEMIRGMLPYSECKVEQIALALNLSARTLQRKMQASGDSFFAVRDRVRADLALRFLRQSKLAQSEIADILGYGDVTAFSRAFRRWHGVAPGQASREQSNQYRGHSKP